MPRLRLAAISAVAGLLTILWSGGAQAASPLAEVIRSSAESDRLNLGAIGAAYDDAVVGDAGFLRVLRRLQVFADGRDRPPRQRAHIHLVRAHFHWRHGDRADALAAVETALGTHETTDGLLLKARLLDAAGDAAAALPFYTRALAATDRQDEAEFIRIRLTMAQARARNVDALVELARGRDQSFRNRAAIALAILGHPDLAVGIYRVSEGERSQVYREHVRLAQWALASGDHAAAQRQAWLAFDAARLELDARYALALLVESHRRDDGLTRLIADLDNHGVVERQGDLDELRVDLLIETQQYDTAIAFYEARAANGDGGSPGVIGRLIDLYGAAGRSEDMVREYHRLMAEEPDVVDWFAGLASHYVGIGRRDDAIAVWQTFETAGAAPPQAMVAAGERMIGMGFLEEAVAMMERQMARSGDHVAGLLFLFDVRLERGRDDDALAILERLAALLPPGHSAVRDLADAYERMNRPERALEVMETLATVEGGLGYDERMRLAWLYSLAGRRQEALETWRELWVSVDSAARRSLAEDQFLLLAAELNTLADIVVELEAKLYAGEADRNEMDLLVRIYTEVGDSLSATEVIEEVSRSGRVGGVERLRQLAGVYRLLGDYPRYDTVLRLLIENDPDNELEHVQNLVLNLLAHDLAEDSDARYGEIQRWLARLHELDTGSVTGEFEAGVLSLGGFDNEAVESYRRALVRNPENSDNLLLMADRMKRVDRSDEAVTMLQYAAEHAIEDDTFVVAVDGIINMIGARSFGERLAPELSGIFEWTERVILERITGHDGKFYLYQLLADIAEETENTEGVFLALENALPLAGIRRPAVLRELVTLATPGSGYAGFDTGRGDLERLLIHGRRLIGLRQALPPDVYIELGRALLDKDDVAGAEKAFDRIEDITGTIDVDRTKGDLLYQAGYPERALGHYGRALSVNQDNLGLLARTAMLHEIRGHSAVANEMYLRAIVNLLRAEAQTRPGKRATNPGAFNVGFIRPVTGASRDHRTYFEFLAQGLLSTWPQDDEAAGERRRAIEAAFHEALRAVPENEDREDASVADYPRLDLTAQFVRRLAASFGDRAMTERVDLALNKRFPNEDGEPLPVVELSMQRRHLERARHRGDFGGAVQLARLMGDEAALVDVLRNLIAEGRFQAGLVNAWKLLDEAAFRRLVTPLASTLKDEPTAFLWLVGWAPHLVPAMEKTLGREFVSVAGLIGLLDQSGGQRDDPLRSHGMLQGIWRYVKHKGGAADQVRFVARIAEGLGQRDMRTYDIVAMVGDLLSKPLSDGQRAMLADALTAHLSQQDLDAPFALHNQVNLLLHADVLPANLPALYALASYLQDRSPTRIDLAAVLTDLYEGTPDRGFARLAQLWEAQLWYPGSQLQVRLAERFAGERERILAAVERGDAVPKETARLAYEMAFKHFGPLPPNTLKRQAHLAPHFAALDPRDSRYRLDGINALLELGEWSAAEDALYAYHRHEPEDEFARAALYFRLVEEGSYEAARRVVTNGGADLRDPSVVDALLARTSRTDGGSAGVFRRLYPGPTPGDPHARYSAAVRRNIDRLRDAARAYADHGPSLAETTGRASAGRDAIDGVGRSLRAVWRGMHAPADDGSPHHFGGHVNVGGLLTLPLDAEASRNPRLYRSSAHVGSISGLVEPSPEHVRLFEALVEIPGVARELERLIPSLPEYQRRGQPQLYELLADALDAANLAEVRLAELSSRLQDGEIGVHAFALWLTLQHRAKQTLSAEALAAFKARAVELDSPTSMELRAVARVLAAAGAHAEALEYYELLVARLIRGRAYNPVIPAGVGIMLMQGAVVRVVSPGGSGSSGTGLREVLAEAAEMLPPETALEFARRILALARPTEDDEALMAVFDAFVLNTLANILGPGDVLAEAARISPSATAAVAPTESWLVPKALELVRIHAMAGNTPTALRLLRDFAVRRAREAAAVTFPFSLDPEQSRRQGAIRALANTLGLRLLGGEFEPTFGLVDARERLFPGESDHVWPGAGEWMRSAAAAMEDWLDDARLDPAKVREMLFVVAWQLNASGNEAAARDIVVLLGTRLGAETDVDRAELRNLVVMALRIGGTVPADLAAAAVASGTLTAEQEARLVRALAARGDTAGALRTGRAADRGDRRALMRALRPVALAANDTAYAEDLKARLEAAQAAYRELGSPARP